MTNKSKLLERIIVDPQVMLGKPVIKGTRLTVELILGLLAQGRPIQEILKQYPRLTENDLLACFQFATEVVADISFVPTFSKDLLKQ